MNNRSNLKSMMYMAMYLALFVVLDWIATQVGIFRMPNGGTLGLGVIPLCMASYHLGWKKGVFVALLAVILLFMIEGIYLIQRDDGFSLFSVFLQFMMEYPLAFGIYGLCSTIPNYKRLHVGTVVFGFVRLALHTIAGAVYWGSPWMVSFTYNAWYMIPTTLVSLIVVSILMPRLQPLLNRLARQ